MEKDELLLSKRIMELARICDTRDVPTHTDFLNLNEQTIFHRQVKDLPPVPYELTGGYSLAERKMVCFLPSYGFAQSAPISWIKIDAKNPKFSEQLTHRDYLGAIMNLGIDRGRVGDILVKEQTAYLVCMEDIASFIQQELTKVRHTSVTCLPWVFEQQEFVQNYKEICASVASLRLDAILAMVFHMSRNQVSPYIEGEKVFINGKLTLSPSCLLKQSDIVSVRGLGKFVYQGIKNQTKKGRIMVVVHQYV